MSNRIDLSNPFLDVFKVLNVKDQKKAMRSAMRREAKRLQKAAMENLATARSGGKTLGRGTNQEISSGIRVRVYPEKYGAGFMLSVKPRKNGKGTHRNRKEKKKPVLMWAEDGTDIRRTKSKTRCFVRIRKGHLTGRMGRYGFMRKTENEASQSTEENLFRDFQANINKSARKQGLL